QSGACTTCLATPAVEAQPVIPEEPGKQHLACRCECLGLLSKWPHCVKSAQDANSSVTLPQLLTHCSRLYDVCLVDGADSGPDENAGTAAAVVSRRGHRLHRLLRGSHAPHPASRQGTCPLGASLHTKSSGRPGFSYIIVLLPDCGL